MNDTLLRQWAMLRLIPRYPRRIDAPAIHKHLAAQGMYVTLRTVQRDLASLCTAFPLDFDDARPQGWWWRMGVGQLDVPSMDAHTALTFSLVEQHMKNLLPPTTLNYLSPWFETAQRVAASATSSVIQWKDKLRVIPHTLNKVPAKVDQAIQATIYEGLLQGKQLQVTYRAISTVRSAKSYPVHPLGLVVMEQVVYLVCSVKDYPDPRFLALHRIERAQLIEQDAIVPSGFDIDAFIAKEFGIRVGDEPLDLAIRVRGILGRYLSESPLAKGQRMTRLDEHWTRVEVRVPNTVQVRVWLRSLGSDVVIEQPAALREEIISGVKELSTHYDVV